jgi:hypothetical protein
LNPDITKQKHILGVPYYLTIFMVYVKFSRAEKFILQLLKAVILWVKIVCLTAILGENKKAKNSHTTMGRLR